MKQLSLVFAILLVGLLAVMYWINKVAVNAAISEIFGAAFTGLKILFFTALILGSLYGMAWAALEIRRHAKVQVIGPSRDGHYKQAIVHKGEVIHLQQPNSQQQLDPAQQMVLLQKFIQTQSQIAKYAQRTNVQEVVESAQPREIVGPASALPTDVNYEDIRAQVPKGHILVGIGRKGIETREYGVGACVWIVGLSGTGKTSTTVLRVEERASVGHKFLGVDPHAFKNDSLTNAIKPYASRFLMPIAQTPEDTNTVLNAFLGEFYARKGGKVAKPWQPITLVVDEVGALMDATDDVEEENAGLIKRIARICGQESRDFNMGGIFISQQATGLAWLRKVALMVIVHQLLQESEKKLATNNDTAVMLDMKTWPIGRTYVFGVGFGTDGPRTVQQPRFSPSPDRIVDSTITSVTEDPSSQVPSNNQAANMPEDSREAAQEASGRADEVDYSFELKKLLREAGRLRAKGVATDTILKELGLKPGGRNNQDLQALLDMVERAEGE